MVRVAPPVAAGHRRLRVSGGRRERGMAGMVPEDVFALTGVSDPRVSPDGTTVAYVVGTVDGEANEYRGAMWLAPPADG